MVYFGLLEHCLDVKGPSIPLVVVWVAFHHQLYLLDKLISAFEEELNEFLEDLGLTLEVDDKKFLWELDWAQNIAQNELFVHSYNAIAFVRVVMARQLQHHPQIALPLRPIGIGGLDEQIVNRYVTRVHRVMLKPYRKNLNYFSIKVMLLGNFGCLVIWRLHGCHRLLQYLHHLKVDLVFYKFIPCEIISILNVVLDKC